MEAAVAGVGKSMLNCLLSGAKAAIDEDVATKQVFQRDLPFLREELDEMHSFLVAADEDWNKNNVPRSRLKQVRDLSRDVEDCLEDFSVHSGKRSWWRIAHTRLERHRIAEEMKGLRARVEDMGQRNSRYRLGEDLMLKHPHAAMAVVQQQSVSAAAVFDIDEARRAMKHYAEMDLERLMINRGHEDLHVIAVWGVTADLGQTSIIRTVYDNPDTASRFMCRAWVRMMRPFNPKEFVQSLVAQFQPPRGVGVDILLEMEEKTGQELADEFKIFVNNHRYLIVLTDLCTIEEWDLVKNCFPDNKKGSRIIVSTTQVEIASLCAGHGCIASQLRQLSPGQTIYAFHAMSSSNEATTSTTVGRSLTRLRTLEASWKEFHLIGREREKSEITELISNQADTQRFKVISVWGMSGIGKTTLIKDIYERLKAGSKFDRCAFVRVMHPFTFEDLLISLVMQLSEGTFVKKYMMGLGSKTRLLFISSADLIKESSHLVHSKKCLIVFDDISSTVEWNMVLPILCGMEATSRIIVTTKEAGIAMHCSVTRENIYILRGLDDDDACTLFTKKVFKENVQYLYEEFPELVEQARLLLKKCMGVPLAILIVGGFLAHRPTTIFEWRKLNERITANLEMNPVAVIKTVIDTIYDGLPYHLKCCFLYMSIFPRGHNVSRRRLVRRWTVEGYSKETPNMSAEEIADTYFMQLIDRSMILPSQKSILGRKGIDSCQVNSLVYEICISKSMEENLVFRLEEGCSLNNQGIIRHLAASNNWKGDKSEFESIVDLSRIRSLTVFGEWKSFFISDKMRLLRVLDLEGTLNLVDHNLKLIGKLLHLKYLFLRGCRGIFHLPDSLGNLWQLHTLDIRDTSIIKLPKSITKLRKLKYLHTGRKAKNEIDSYEEDLEGAPTVLSKYRLCYLSMLLCLSCAAITSGKFLDDGMDRRDMCFAFWCALLPYATKRLDIHGVLIPRWMSKLKALETLGVVNIAGRGKMILRDIRRLTRLRKLAVTGINRRNCLHFCSAVANLNLLESLSIRSEGCPGLAGCLDDSTHSPPENLLSFKLYGNLVKLPEWIKGLRNLEKLKLRSCRISDADAAMQVIGNLPKLAILRLLNESLEGGAEVCFTFGRGTFQSLRVLQLKLVGKLKSVRFEQGATPKLERLQFSGLCSEEENSVSSFSGLSHLSGLNELILDSGHYSGSLRLVKDLQAQLDMNPNRPVLWRRFVMT